MEDESSNIEISKEVWDEVKPKINSNTKGKCVIINSPLSEKLLDTYWNKRPNPKHKKEVEIWKEELNSLIDLYNQELGFECWGKEFPEPYNKE